MTQHLSEDELIAYALGEAGDGIHDVERHAAGCDDCRAEIEALRTTLEAAAAVPVPDRGAGYGGEVWARVAPLLPEARRVPRPVIRADWRPWLAAAAVLLAIAGAFIAGRWSRGPAAPLVSAEVTPDAGAIRERVVLSALGEHLDRTERTLVELVNAKSGAAVDITAEQAWARDLLDANRLYRQSARGTTSPALRTLLDELEPVLLDIIHSPGTLSSDEFHALRSRIEDRSLVFKLRVSGADVRARQKTLLHPGEKTS